MTSKLYTDSDNDLLTTVTKESDGTVFPTSSISNAEYYLMNTINGNVILSKTLGDGITVKDADTLKTRLEDSEMTMGSGLYWHKMVIYNQAGDKLPPVFNEQVIIE